MKLSKETREEVHSFLFVVACIAAVLYVWAVAE
jgi:nitrate reductase NapE component